MVRVVGASQARDRQVALAPVALAALKLQVQRAREFLKPENNSAKAVLDFNSAKGAEAISPENAA